MNSIEIQEEIYQLMDDIANIKNQLDFADDDILNGVEVDREWMHNAKHALRKKNIQLLRFSHDLGRANKEEKQLENKNYVLYTKFVSEAKKILSKSQYEEIMLSVKSQMQ